MDISKKDWKLFREKLSGWQENYIECLSRACVILEVGLKLHQRIQGVYYSNAESEL